MQVYGGLDSINSLVVSSGWHPMCAEGMSEEELSNVGRTVCRQIYNTNSSFVRAYITPNSMYTNIRGVTCRGTEKQLADCPDIHLAPKNTVFNCSSVIKVICELVSKYISRVL